MVIIVHIKSSKLKSVGFYSHSSSLKNFNLMIFWFGEFTLFVSSYYGYILVIFYGDIGLNF